MTRRIERAGRVATLALAAAAIAGCGTAPTSLRPMAQPTSIQLQSPVKWTLSRHLHEFHDTLVAGTYVAVGESDEGTFYMGPAPCLVEANVLKDKPDSWGGIARDCGIFKPRNASAPPTVFFVQNGFWMATEFDADGTPHLEHLKDHRNLAGQPDAAPQRSVLDPNAPIMPAAVVAGAGHNPMVAGAGGALGTSLVAGFIAADMGTYHDVDTQPPAGWLEAALAGKAGG
jgi:hypothetical protein